MISALLFVLALAVPNRTVTPGVTRPITREALCSTKWRLDRRMATVSMKKTVAAKYHVSWAKHADYEFDHLIPRELGGADELGNLWPQPWPSAHKKDRLENKLHVLVCKGQLDLATAQREIASDWRLAYYAYVIPVTCKNCQP